MRMGRMGRGWSQDFDRFSALNSEQFSLPLVLSLLCGDLVKLLTVQSVLCSE